MFSEKVSFISLNRKKNKLCLCFPAVWFLLFEKKKSYLKKKKEKGKRHKGLCAKNRANSLSNRADQFKREPREFIADFHGDGNY